MGGSAYASQPAYRQRCPLPALFAVRCAGWRKTLFYAFIHGAISRSRYRRRVQVRWQRFKIAVQLSVAVLPSALRAQASCRSRRAYGDGERRVPRAQPRGGIQNVTQR